MNFVHRVFYVANFSNMVQRQRARHCKQRHNSNAWIKDEDRMKTSLTEKKWKQFQQPLFECFEFFQRWQLEPVWNDQVLDFPGVNDTEAPFSKFDTCMVRR